MYNNNKAAIGAMECNVTDLNTISLNAVCTDFAKGDIPVPVSEPVTVEDCFNHVFIKRRSSFSSSLRSR
jgi:hypothetical protein